jgi:hypothetical protein
MVHVSNRYLELEPVVAGNLANGWHASVRRYWPSPEEGARQYGASIWIALSRNPDTLKKLKDNAPEEEWAKLDSKPGFEPWTDDFASILPILRPFWKR